MIIQAGEDHIHISKNKGDNHHKIKSAYWFDRECIQQRVAFHNAAHEYKKSDLTEDRLNMCSERAKYRRLCITKKNYF